MALIRCRECGQEISDKASECPNCGCPVKDKDILLNHNNNEMPVYYEEEVNEKSYKWLFGIIAILLTSIFGLGYYLFSHQNNNFVKSEGENSIKDVTTEKEENTKYTIIIYDDDSGDFLAPDGGRICGVSNTIGRASEMSVWITKEVKIFGIRVDCLRFIEGRLYASYGDYLDYKHSDGAEGKNKSCPVDVEETDKMTKFMFELQPDQIEKTQTIKLNLPNVKENYYTMVMYSDNYGSLYGPGGKRLCGLRKSIYNTAEYEWVFEKEIDIFGEMTRRLSAENGYLYYNAVEAKIREKEGDTSERIAKVTVTQQGDATILSFPNERLETDRSNASNDVFSASVQQNLPDDYEWKQWLQGRWVRAEIDPTMVEMVYYVYTFHGNGFNFTYGSEYTYNPSMEYFEYSVKDGIIYTKSGSPFLRIDKSGNRLIDIKDPEIRYSRK